MKSIIRLLALSLVLFATNLASASDLNIQADRYYRYDFGNQFLHSLTFADFQLSSGDADLKIEGIRISGIDYDAQSNCPRILPARQFCTIRVYFKPTMEGFRHGRLVVYKPTDAFVVDLVGYGRR